MATENQIRDLQQKAKQIKSRASFMQTKGSFNEADEKGATQTTIRAKMTFQEKAQIQAAERERI
jgi:hypothetical protein